MSNAGDLRQQLDEQERQVQQTKHQLREAERDELADNLVKVARRLMDDGPRRFADALEIAVRQPTSTPKVNLEMLVVKLVDIAEGR